MVGYDSIAPAAPLVAAVVPPPNPWRSYLRQLRTQIAAQGFTEIYSYSFVNETDIKRFHGDPASHIAVRNPIAAELTHLRRSLLPGLFKAIATNVRYFPEFRLFEIGSEIHSRTAAGLPDADLPNEVLHLAAALYNAHGNEQDFFELKRVTEALFPGSRLTATTGQLYEHPFRASRIHWQNAIVGRLFELHPSLLQAEGIEGRAVLFDVDLTVTRPIAEAHIANYTHLRKYPASGFDLSVVTSLRTPVDRIQDELAELAGTHLARIEFIRQYDGPPLPHGQKSVSYRLEVGSLDHSMTTEEVTGILNRIIQGMHALGYELRGL